TFSCYLVTETGEQELMRHHHAEATWKNYAFDLMPWAGKEVTLRLQIEPGPANNPSWDYSYFGEAKITAGTAQESAVTLLDTLTASKAYRATAEASLTRLGNYSHGGILPSNLLTHKNSIRKVGEGYRFSYEGDDCRIVYDYRPRTGSLDDFTVKIDDGAHFQPALGGGLTAEFGEAAPTSLRTGALVEMALTSDGRFLRALWDYPTPGSPLRVEWRFGIVGKALAVEVDCVTPVVTGFALGCGAQPLRKSFAIPYFAGQVSYYPAARVFSLRYLDWTASHSSQSPHGTAAYHKKTDGTRNALHEEGYIAISPDVREVLPNIPHPPSPYLDLLGPKIMLDIWGHHKGTYQGDAENLRALKDNGVDHVAIISHVWQRFGYDVKLPDHIPADPRFGGDEGMIEFGKAANESGYVWSLHENYIDIYPDAPSYDPAVVVQNSDGSPSKAWFNQG
ncbi:MAG: hypothetical protein GY851_22575, partial [bacterium]|nr:hypothetical protein [bacterium]